MDKDNNSSEGQNLCLECGLCCQGIFHLNAALYNEKDIDIIKKSKLSYEFSKERNAYVFVLPCAAFDQKCTIYDQDRPYTCSKHECELLKNVLRKNIKLENAIKTVIKMKSTLNTLIPEFKILSNTNNINHPETLLKKITDSLKSEEELTAFKQNNKKLLLDYGTFIMLKAQHFYKSL